MKLKRGNIFRELDADAICITTNGFVKKNGDCVMGRGIAKQVADRYTNIPSILGFKIKMEGNNVHKLINTEAYEILSFPVKPVSKVCESSQDYVGHMNFNIGDTIPGWACKADIEIIKRSAHQLVELANEEGWEKVVLPYAGCGAGELNWDDVCPVLSEILDDRFIAMTY